MSKAYLLDTETNIGPKEGEPEVIELAYLPLPDNVIDVNEDEFSKTTFIFDRFYQPETPISHSAMAVHRITPRRLGELAMDKSSQARDHLPPDLTYMVVTILPLTTMYWVSLLMLS